jgi:hypothetical protein
MYLLTTDLIAILIALISACGVMVWSVLKYNRLLQQNKDLRKVIKILQMQKKVDK